MWGYRTRDVARMLGLPESRVRSFARAGFVRSQRGQAGKIRISATAEGLRSADAQIATSTR